MHHFIQANGGNGYNNGQQGGGGGSGGRIAVYYRENEDYDGTIEAYGGFGNDEYGAAGTIYHHHVVSDNTTKRSLYVDNNDHRPQTERVNQARFPFTSFVYLFCSTCGMVPYFSLQLS